MWKTIISRMKKQQFNYALFLVCFVHLFVLPMLNITTVWYYRYGLSLILLLSVMSLNKLSHKAVLIGLITVILNLVANVGHESQLDKIMDWFSFVFLIWVIARMVLQVMKVHRVEPVNLLMALNGYLLLGILFSSLVFYTEHFSPGSFAESGKIPDYPDLVYFTLITLTTTGYGDLLPVTHTAKHLSLLVAISGQFYVAVIVAILVGKYTNVLIEDRKDKN
ncbi:MAG TPA: ion channel [Bacteroidia bacterium]|nr:ion channel [Bacteroidia bacterium]